MLCLVIVAVKILIRCFSTSTIDSTTRLGIDYERYHIRKRLTSSKCRSCSITTETNTPTDTLLVEGAESGINNCKNDAPTAATAETA